MEKRNVVQEVKSSASKTSSLPENPVGSIPLLTAPQNIDSSEAIVSCTNSACHVMTELINRNEKINFNYTHGEDGKTVLVGQT